MEATIFTGWIYYYLLLHAAAFKVAHPLMSGAIVAAKKKNDPIDTSKIADSRVVIVRFSSTSLRSRFGIGDARCGIEICRSDESERILA